MREELVGGPASLFQKLAAHFVRNPSETVSHELGHQAQDTEGIGQLGVILAPALIEYTRQVIQYAGDIINVFKEKVVQIVEVAVAAFYRPLGPRTPQARINIAEGPGEGKMSAQDRRVRDRARRELQAQQNPSPFSPGSSGLVPQAA